MTDALTPEMRRDIAAWLRSDGGDAPSETVDAWADALDPRPTLRDAVALAICASDDGVWSRADTDAYRRNADAALAVVRDHIAALRGHTLTLDDVLALLDRGGSDELHRALVADLGAES